MKWRNVRLIFQRELRDQLRDRRTLFMILILPILLYPLMGLAAFQISQFLQEHPTRVVMLGADELPTSPALLDESGVRKEWFSSPERVHLLEIERRSRVPRGSDQEQARKILAEGSCDAVVVFPKQFNERLQAYIQASREAVRETNPPMPRIFFSGNKDRSRVCFERLAAVLERWRTQIVRQTLHSHQLSIAAVEPFVVKSDDVSPPAQRRGALWSKILPFVLVVWALTGAFYPAVDLCAGEKERGTLETLLCSPAERLEIVWGKLLTVSLFSILTSMLNLISMTITGATVMSRIAIPSADGTVSIGSPPVGMFVWLVVALIPLAALFGALALALATMARSTKEGQYYLMPLLLTTLPLAMVTVLPTSEISLGNALIPVTGVMMVLRSLLEGDWPSALRYAIPVIVVTGVCCSLALRWAVHQFNDESVLFRESEQFSPRLWLWHLIRDRGVTPSLAEGVMAGVGLLILQFFARLAAPSTVTWPSLALSTLVLQIVFFLVPILAMTFLLTASPSRTLLLRPASSGSIIAAVMLAIFIQPAAIQLTQWIQSTYPMNAGVLQQLTELSHVIEAAPIWQRLLVLAVLPAIVEELAFRGFILSGLRHLGRKRMAILISSLFFGVVHSILQQSIHASILGLVLGFIAVQSGSIFPCMLFHVLHNGFQVIGGQALHTVAGSPLMLVVSILACGVILRWFRSLPASSSPEERLQDALEQQSAVVLHG